MSTPKPSTRVFVYGTLRAGESNHRMMSGARFVGEARTEGAFTLVDLGSFPALREGGTTAVVGEVYEVTGEQLGALDLFEGVPRLYERIEVRLEGGDGAHAYVQRGARRGGREIASGDWRGTERSRGMRVRVRDEDRIFEGTPKQIVQGMQRTAIFAAHLSLDEYVSWCVRNAGLMGLDVKVTGEAIDERCAALIEEMIRVGFAERL